MYKLNYKFIIYFLNIQTLTKTDFYLNFNEFIEWEFLSVVKKS